MFRRAIALGKLLEGSRRGRIRIPVSRGFWLDLEALVTVPGPAASGPTWARWAGSEQRCLVLMFFAGSLPRAGFGEAKGRAIGG
ncbi:hypothetical protein CYA_0105 [Synechococcus sp. JA-3-3Ab]|nr:hypothetical protein CYA_0105 [Synechococcus sp. JA-3-3Ab]